MRLALAAGLASGAGLRVGAAGGWSGPLLSGKGYAKSLQVRIVVYVYIYIYNMYMVRPPSDLPFVVVLSTFSKGSAPKNDKIPQN